MLDGLARAAHDLPRHVRIARHPDDAEREVGDLIGKERLAQAQPDDRGELLGGAGGLGMVLADAESDRGLLPAELATGPDAHEQSAHVMNGAALIERLPRSGPKRSETTASICWMTPVIVQAKARSPDAKSASTRRNGEDYSTTAPRRLTTPATPAPRRDAPRRCRP